MSGWHPRFANSGEKVLDGKERGLELRMQAAPAKYKQISDQVKEMLEEGILLLEIAERLDYSRDLITRAVRWCYESQGLPVPDGRSRRKTLKVKERPRKEPNTKSQG